MASAEALGPCRASWSAVVGHTTYSVVETVHVESTDMRVGARWHGDVLLRAISRVAHLTMAEWSGYGRAARALRDASHRSVVVTPPPRALAPSASCAGLLFDITLPDPTPSAAMRTPPAQLAMQHLRWAMAARADRRVQGVILRPGFAVGRSSPRAWFRFLRAWATARVVVGVTWTEWPRAHRARLEAAAEAVIRYGLSEVEIPWASDGYPDIERLGLRITKPILPLLPLDPHQATEAQLRRVPGIGSETARALIKARNAHTLRSLEDFVVLGTDLALARPYLDLDHREYVA
jgi:hypothetical protein